MFYVLGTHSIKQFKVVSQVFYAQETLNGTWRQHKILVTLRDFLTLPIFACNILDLCTGFYYMSLYKLCTVCVYMNLYIYKCHVRGCVLFKFKKNIILSRWYVVKWLCIICQ
jgi:hypothetical protein